MLYAHLSDYAGEENNEHCIQDRGSSCHYFVVSKDVSALIHWEDTARECTHVEG